MIVENPLEDIMKKQGYAKDTECDEECLRKLNMTGGEGVTYGYDGEAMCFKQQGHFETIETNLPTIAIKTKRNRKLLPKILEKDASRPSKESMAESNLTTERMMTAAK